MHCQLLLQGRRLSAVGLASRAANTGECLQFGAPCKTSLLLLDGHGRARVRGAFAVAYFFPFKTHDEVRVGRTVVLACHDDVWPRLRAGRLPRW